MKKSLLIGASLLCAPLLASALEPVVLDNFQAVSVSPDGKTVGSYLMSTVSFYDVENGTFETFEGDDEVVSYWLGHGNNASAEGTFVGRSSLDGNCSWYKDGEWHALKTFNASLVNLANGITADGSRICGSLGLQPISTEDTDTPMSVPAIWDRNADGTYGDPVALPYPELDFTGRVPQYVTANCISDDGKTVVGQVVDYGGWMICLIVYTQNENGEWSYKCDTASLNPNNHEFPEDPGECPMMPQMTDFMTEEELAAVQAAIDAWYEEGTWDYSTYPQYADFMTDEEKEAYETAYAEWEAIYEEWDAKWTAFMTTYQQCQMEGMTLTFNSSAISPDGKMAASGHLLDTYDDDWNPIYRKGAAIYSIEDGDFTVSKMTTDNTLPTQVMADYTVLAAQAAPSEPSKAVVYLPGADEAIDLRDYLASRNTETVDWINENMIHDVSYYDYNTWTMVTLEDAVCTGSPNAPADLSFFATHMEITWESTELSGYVASYILPSGDDAAVKGVAGELNSAVKALKGGKIMISGAAADLNVYDAQGRRVFSAKDANGMIETGLSNGVYVVVANTAEGKQTLKVVF
ncbi:MAG: T9SS type A sorting domain-containing protein [Lepagella sp.]